MKICFKCKVEKPLAEFYRHPKMADGHLNKCKSCARKDVCANRLARIDYYREVDRIRQKKPDRAAAAQEVCKRWREEDRRRMRAHNMVHRAVKAGKLIPQPCEVEGCERMDVHAHHDDYDKPLSVNWLCPPHHRKRHQKLERMGIKP